MRVLDEFKSAFVVQIGRICEGWPCLKMCRHVSEELLPVEELSQCARAKP
jgi:hypothetical protein